MRQPTAVTESIGDDPAKLIEAFVETVCNVGKAASFSILPNASILPRRDHLVYILFADNLTTFSTNSTKQACENQ